LALPAVNGAAFFYVSRARTSFKFMIDSVKIENAPLETELFLLVQGVRIPSGFT